MEMRDFGRSGIRVSLLGFGCGAVGGLMVRGNPADHWHIRGGRVPGIVVGHLIRRTDVHGSRPVGILSQ